MSERSSLRIGPVRRLILLGFSEIFDELVSFSRRNNLDVIIITSPDQILGLEKLEIEPLVVEDLADNKVKSFILGGAEGADILGISFGARWIFRSETIDDLFGGRLLNAHGTRLPLDRGAGGFSWRILRGDRLGSLLLHKVEPGIDEGPIVRQQTYVIPRHCRTPEELSHDYTAKLLPFVQDFISDVAGGEREIQLFQQPGYLSTYFPRLWTPDHAWIDWSWDPLSIERFISAFDNPYQGAMTFWRGKRVHLKAVQIHVGEAGFHPFQSGLVIRKTNSWLIVGLHADTSLIIEDVRDGNGDDVMPNVRVGDRFWTSAETLDAARQKRVTVGPAGVENQSYMAGKSSP